MALRIFQCQSCGHKMRMAGQMCHACHAPKRPYQNAFLFWPLCFGVLVVLCALVLAVP